MKEENKLYQLVCHISPIIGDDVLEGLIKKMSDLFTANNALLVSEDDLSKEKISKHKLAYPIKKFKESFYLVVNFLADGQAVNNISRQTGLEKNIIRHMITSVKKPVVASREIIDYKATEQIESLSRNIKDDKPVKNAKKAGIAGMIDKIISTPQKTVKKNRDKISTDTIQESKVEIDKLDQKLEEILNQ